MPLKRLERLNTKDMLWVYVLRILREKPMHAYVIRKEVEKRFGFRPGTVTAYRVLYSLKHKGMVSVKKEGRKKVYIITPKGEALLKDAVNFYKQRIELLK